MDEKPRESESAPHPAPLAGKPWRRPALRLPSTLQGLPITWPVVSGLALALVFLVGLYWLISAPIRDRQARLPSATPGALALVLQGDELLAKGRLEEAMSAYSQTLALDPNNARALAHWGWALTVRGKTVEAIQRLGRATELAPSSGEYRALLALAYDWGSQYDRAGVEAQAAFRLEPGNARVLAVLAEVLSDSGRPAEAVDYGRRAVAADANSADAHRAYGYALQAAGDLTQGAAELRRAVELAPNLAYLRLSLAALYRSAGQYPEALAEYQKAVDLEPFSPQGHEGLGTVYYRQKQYDTAVPYFARAADLDPNRFSAQNYLAWSQYLTEHYDLAIPHFQRALEIDNSRADGHAGLGWALLNLKLTEQARGEFEKALALDPQLKLAQDGLAAAKQQQP